MSMNNNNNNNIGFITIYNKVYLNPPVAKLAFNGNTTRDVSRIK